VYERLERFAQLPATRVCAPFLLGGALMLLAFAEDAPRALQAGGIIALLATLVLIREARAIPVSDLAAEDLSRHLYGAALHAALFAMSFFLAAIGMAIWLPA
jgi:hypothetical protein